MEIQIEYLNKLFSQRGPFLHKPQYLSESGNIIKKNFRVL